MFTHSKLNLRNSLLHILLLSNISKCQENKDNDLIFKILDTEDTNPLLLADKQEVDNSFNEAKTQGVKNKDDSSTVLDPPEELSMNNKYLNNIDIENCNNINLKLNDPVKKTAVTSFPGSGNTWMRHLLHMGTGYHTGSIYHDGKLKDKGFLGEGLEWDDDRVVGIKLHKMGYLKKLANEREKDMNELMQKAVLLIRSPYRALMSEFNRVNNAHHLHVGKADPTAFTNGTWDTFLSQNIEKWQTSITSWTEQFTGDVHVVCYEDLKENTFENLDKILNFMEVEFARPHCIQANTDGSFKRKSATDAEVKRYFNSRQRQQLLDNIQIVKDSLRLGNHKDCTELF